MTSSPSPAPEPRTPLVGPAPMTHTVELPAYVPGEFLDVPSPDVTIPTRGIRPRRRSRLQSVLIGLSSGTVLLLVAGVLVLATLLSPIGARRTARTAAEQELRSQLEPGERVLGQAYVSQRNWWDNFRESFGVLAATDRRLIFVGMPPARWIHSTEDDGPPEARVQSFSYDAPFTAHTHRSLVGIPGVVVQTQSDKVTFLVPRGEANRVHEIEQVVQRAQIAQSTLFEREQLGRIAPPPPPPKYVSHLVRGGESVTSIARRYHTTPDVIRQLNRLPNDRIRIGQRLRVPQSPDSVRAPTGPAPQPSTVP
jgi:LysM repeat protein